MTKQAGGDRPLQILASLYLKAIYLVLVVMFDYERNWCHICFKGIFGINTNYLGKCLILLATLLFIGEEQFSLFTLLNTGLSRQFCSEKF